MTHLYFLSHIGDREVRYHPLFDDIEWDMLRAGAEPAKYNWLDLALVYAAIRVDADDIDTRDYMCPRPGYAFVEMSESTATDSDYQMDLDSGCDSDEDCYRPRGVLCPSFEADDEFWPENVGEFTDYRPVSPQPYCA